MSNRGGISKQQVSFIIRTAMGNFWGVEVSAPMNGRYKVIDPATLREGKYRAPTWSNFAFMQHIVVDLDQPYMVETYTQAEVESRRSRKSGL